MGTATGTATGIDSAQEIDADANKKPVMIRIDGPMIERIDRAAKRLGLSRSAFIVLSAAERLERMEGTPLEGQA